MELLSLMPIVGFALAWQRLRGTNAASALLHSVALIMLLLFAASLFGVLRPAALSLIVVGILQAAVELGRHVRDRNPLPVPVGLFAILCVAYWLLHSDASLFYYDEYSHWGVYLKEIIARHELWGADTNSMHPRYLPGTPLWQYFFALLSDNMEGAAYLAQFALLMAPLLVLWEKTDWGQPFWLIGIVVFVTIAVSNFGHGFTSLYVDHLLGAWFAGVLLNFLLEFQDDAAMPPWSYVLPLAAIVLVKSTGLFFAITAAGIIAALVFRAAGGSATRLAAGRRAGRAAAFASATAIACLAVVMVWDSNRDSIGLGADTTSTASVVDRLIERRSIFSAGEQSELSRRYLEVVFHQQVSKDATSARYNAFSYPLMPRFTDAFRLTTASLLGLAAIALLLLLKFVVSPASRPGWTIAGGGTWLAAIAYIVVMFVGYRYVSQSGNGLQLSSYIRYAHSMLLPVVLVCTAPLMPAFQAAGSPLKLRLGTLQFGPNAAIFAALVALLLVFERPYLKPLYTVQTPPSLRAEMQPVADRLRENIGDARLWVFLPNDVRNGFIGRIFRYILSPGYTHVEEDAAPLLETPDELRATLRDFDVLWFAVRNEEIDAAAEALVGGPLGTRVFRVHASGNAVRFEPLADAFDSAGGTQPAHTVD